MKFAMKNKVKKISPTSRKTHQKIFKGALLCISQNGYEKTTIDEIIEASGVSKGSLYYHFENKREIFLKLTDSIVDQHRQSLSEIEALDLSPWQKIGLCIIEVFEKLRADTSRFRAGMELAALALKDRSLKKKQVQVNNLYQYFFSKTITAGIESGDFLATDPD